MNTTYTRPAMVLHWLMAALMLLNVALGLSIDAIPDAWVRPVIDTHKSFGLTVLGLLVLRVTWRIGHRPPPLPASFAPWERVLSQVAHLGLYALLLALPLSGWMHDSAWKDAASHPLKVFYVIPVPRFDYFMHMDPVSKEAMHKLLFAVHRNLAYALDVLVLLHVAGALKHEWIDKESVLSRMGVRLGSRGC